MAARKRNSVEASDSSESEMTYSRFMALFPDNDACVDYLKDKYYPAGTECPSCGKPTKFHRIAGRASYSCQYCRHQVYPTAGTIFEKSTTSLHLWFWAIFLMSSTRCGMSAKQLEREIGVTYPTAHRMFKQIRTLLSDNDETTFSGPVEMDEMYVGGRPRQGEVKAEMAKGNKSRAQAGLAVGRAKKTTVFGMVERGGRVSAHVVRADDSLQATMLANVEARVLDKSIVYTDEALLYAPLEAKGYQHRRIHHAEKVYVQGDVHTNTIEGFWSLVKNGIRGVYHSVSAEYLQSYLDEYSFRFNRRGGDDPIFWAILERVQQVPKAQA